MDKLKVLEGRTVTGKYHGVSSHFYHFSYNGVDERWHEGQVSPILENQESFDEVKGSPMSFWTVEVKKENEMKEMTSALLQLSHDALMQPLFCVYNPQINKIIMACSPGTSDFNKWIAKQVPIPSDGYVSEQGKNMISSVLSFCDTLWKKGFVCTGLDDPKTYRMLSSKIKIIPFSIRRKSQNDNEMIHRLAFAKLLENYIDPKWKDPDLKEFIKLMKDPTARLQDLLSHPLLLPAEKRLALYQTLFPSALSLDQIELLKGLPSFGDWRSKIRPQDELYGVLVHGGDGKEWKYDGTTPEAFRFGCNASSHYMSYWRQTTHVQLREIPKDYADKSLKKILPGLLAQVYGLTFHTNWRCGGTPVVTA